MKNDTKKFEEEMYHFLSRVNFSKSCFDARAITFLNEWTKMLLRVQKEQ